LFFPAHILPDFKNIKMGRLVLAIQAISRTFQLNSKIDSFFVSFFSKVKHYFS